MNFQSMHLHISHCHISRQNKVWIKFLTWFALCLPSAISIHWSLNVWNRQKETSAFYIFNYNLKRVAVSLELRLLLLLDVCKKVDKFLFQIMIWKKSVYVHMKNTNRSTYRYVIYNFNTKLLMHYVVVY